MIKSVTIRDFQSHGDTKLDLSEGINVIVGKSNGGKTAIIRSINWAINNRPLGDSFIKHGKKTSSVVLELAHDKEIIEICRIKGGQKNEYKITGYPEPLTAFGSDPPPQILEATNISDINLQGQFHPYFLVFDSPGQAATYIRCITKLDEIDRIIDDIAKRSRKTQADIESYKMEVDSVHEQLAVLKRIDLESFESNLRVARSISESNGRIEILIKKMGGITNSLKSISEIIIPDDIESTIKSANSTMILLSSTDEKCQKLFGIIDNLNEMLAAQIHIPDSTDEIISLKSEIENKYNKNGKMIDSLINIIGTITEFTDSLLAIEAEIKAEENKLMNLKSKLTECPSCGSVLNEKSKAKLLGSK